MKTKKKQMDCRERAFRTIRFEGPDKIPITYGCAPAALLKHGPKLIEICKRYPNDFYDVEDVFKVPERDAAHYRPDGTYYKEETDEWGATWVFYQEGYAGEVKKRPLDDWSKLAQYRVPPVSNASPEGRRKAREDMKRQKEKYMGWGSAGSLYEQMQWLRGTEDLMMDIAMDCEEVYRLADLIVEQRLIPSIELSLEAGAEAIGFADDWGTQKQLLINPKSWRAIFKPRYKKMFDLVRQGGALSWMHSDGMILEIIPDLVEIGLNVINPQLNCIDLKALRKATHRKIAVCGDIDRQHLMPFGTPAEIRAYIEQLYRLFGSPEGGFMYGPWFADVPPQNVEAVLKAFYEFRDL